MHLTHAGLLLQHNDQGFVVGGGLCDSQTRTGENPCYRYSEKSAHRIVLGALFPFFLLVRLRAFLHVRLFHGRLAWPRHNLTAIHDLACDLAN